MKAILLSLALVIAAASSASAGVWHTTYMTWYGPGFYGQQTACGQTMTDKLIGVAAHVDVKCGTRVEIRYNGHDRIVRVVDHCGCAPGSAFDATARLAIHLTGHPPHTMHNVRYRYLW